MLDASLLLSSVPIMLAAMRRFGVVLLLVFTTLGLAGCGTPTLTSVYTCTQYQSKPTTFTPYCADAGQQFEKINWSYWGSDFANGTGKALTNLCEPNCAAGRVDVTDADITLDKPIKVGAHSAFSELVIKYHDSVAGHPMIEKLSLVTGPMGN